VSKTKVYQFSQIYNKAEMSQMNWRIVFCMCNQLFDLYCLVRIAKTCFAKFCFFSRHTNWQRMSADWHRTSLGRGKFNLSGLIIIIFIIIKKRRSNFDTKVFVAFTPALAPPNKNEQQAEFYSCFLRPRLLCILFK